MSRNVRDRAPRVIGGSARWRIRIICTACEYIILYVYDDCYKATIVGGTRDLLDP